MPEDTTVLVNKKKPIKSRSKLKQEHRYSFIVDHNSAVDLRSRATDKVKITSPAQNDNIKDLSDSKGYFTLPLGSTDCVK